MYKYTEWKQKDKNQVLSYSEVVLISECLFWVHATQSVYFLNYFILILDFLLQYNKFVVKKQ